MAEVVANGVRFNYQRVPPEEGTPRATVVCIHGPVLDNLTSFYFTLAGPLMRSGYEAFLYDLRGHGRSGRPVTGYTAQDAADDFDALMDASGVTEPVYLVGNSYGGTLATQIAMEHPERVAGLVLVEGHGGDRQPEWTERVVNTLTLIATMVEHGTLGVFGALEAKSARARALASQLLNETSIIEDMAASPAMYGPDFGRVRCPVLATFGTKSFLAGGAGDLERQIADCSIEMFEGLGHGILFEDPGKLNEVIVRWIGSHGQ